MARPRPQARAPPVTIPTPGVSSNGVDASGGGDGVAGGVAVVRVKHVIAGYLKHADAYYRRPDGSATSTCGMVRQVCRLLRSLYGDVPAADLGPAALKRFRDVTAAGGWTWRGRDGQTRVAPAVCRTTANKHTRCVQNMYRWAVAEELVGPAVHAAMVAVVPLKRGRCDVREGEGRQPVEVEHVEQALPFMPPVVAAMVRLQLLTAMRPGEVCAMKTGDVKMPEGKGDGGGGGGAWVYTPSYHKMHYRDRPRVVVLGPRARDVARPYVKLDPEAFWFSPADSEAARREAASAARVTPLSCGNRPGTNRSADPKRPPGACYNDNTYRRAVERACDRAFPPPAGLAGVDVDGLAAWRKAHRFTPHRLRHTAATRIRASHDLEAAQTILGHSSADVAEVYARRDLARAVAVMEAVG